jgi:hypothetical protein
LQDIQAPHGGEYALAHLGSEPVTLSRQRTCHPVSGACNSLAAPKSGSHHPPVGPPDHRLLRLPPRAIHFPVALSLSGW